MYNFKITDESFAVGYINAESDSRHIRTGAGYLAAAPNMEINIDPATGLAKVGWGNMSCFTIYFGGQAVCDDRLRAKAEKFPELAEDYLYIIDHMKGDDVCGHLVNCFNDHEREMDSTVTGWGGMWGGHAVPALEQFALIGTNALRERVLRYREMNTDVADLYDGILYTLDAIDIMGERILEKATRMLGDATDDVTRRKLRRIVSAFSHCPKEPAATFAEAVAVYVFIISLDGIDSPGHFDWAFGDIWDRSDYGESREALEDLWHYFHETRTWNLCIGGSDENWCDKTNSLTYEILDVTAKLKFNTPNLTMRCHRNTPEKLLRAAMRTIGSGTAMPTLYNDEAVCPALERLGIPPADSHRYVMNGCNQIDIHGRSHMGLEDGSVNLGMAVKYAVTNGVNHKTRTVVGIKTGEPEQLDSFEKFFDAVKAQIKNITDVACSMSNKSQRLYAKYSSNPIRTLTIEGCLEKGRDYKDGGPLYGHGQILAHGVPDAIDSVANVKYFVYDEKKYTLAQVRDALLSDFNGYDGMLADFRGSGLNFGNDIEYVDRVAGELLDFYNGYLLTKHTVRGGVFGGGCSPLDDMARVGAATGALPNGKRDGEDLYGDSIGATPGRDVNGPTALLRSCLAFDHTLPTSGFILNVRFDKSLWDSSRGEEGFISLYKAFFEKNRAQQLSVTVLSRDELLDAVANPDAHRDLIVRVGGYSGYFVDFAPEVQQNIIARTDHCSM